MLLKQSTDISLPDLSVKGFRGIKDLSISRLGRVTLFTGENGVGKTTLLDTIRVYASRGNYRVLNDILRSREELSLYVDEDNDEFFVPDWDALFYGRSVSSDTQISLGPKNKSRQLRVGISSEGTTRSSRLGRGEFSSDDSQALKVEFQNTQQEIPLRHLIGRYSEPKRVLRDIESDSPHTVRCESLGPGLLNNAALARFWDKVALTDDEDKAVKALNLIFKDKVERAVLIGDRSRGRHYVRRAVVKMENEERPFPLKRLGDGAVRLFGVALALANSQDGFLVIDEAENGIHHSIQRGFWEMILRTAEENNVQVFATTHSWDCVAGFAQAAMELDEVDGALVRIERHGSDTRAVEYSEEKLEAAAEYGIEVR